MRLDENINRIKEVMGLITEAPTQGLEINLSNSFESGKYIVTPKVASTVNNAILQIRNFITKNPGKPILVTIESSESKVPNYDREKFPATGNKNTDFTPDKKLPVGALSKNRATNLTNYLKSKLPKEVTFSISDKGSQGPPWSSPFNAADPKYTEFQYVKVYAKINVASQTKTVTGSTQTTKVNPKYCNQQIEGSGGKGNPSKGFIAEEKIIELGDGAEMFTFLLDPKSVPDIMIVEYNGKTQTTGFIGSNTESYRLLIGTVIHMRYDSFGSPRPWWFQNLKLTGVQPYRADQLLKKYEGDWEPTDYSHIWPNDPPLSGTFFQTVSKDQDRGFYPKTLSDDAIKPIGVGVNAWDGPSALKIQQVKGVNTAKVTIIGVVGQTEWKLYVKCGTPDALTTTAGGPGGDIKK
jgi:hypothetical protein